MKRQTFRAVVTNGDEVIGERDAYAWNSAVRASEALVREFGRTHGFTLSGSSPAKAGGCGDGKFCHCADTYTRAWTAPNGLEIRATVAQVSA